MLPATARHNISIPPILPVPNSLPAAPLIVEADGTAGAATEDVTEGAAALSYGGGQSTDVMPTSRFGPSPNGLPVSGS